MVQTFSSQEWQTAMFNGKWSMINKRVQVVKELKQSRSLDKRLTTQWLLDPSPFQPIGDSVTGPSAKNKRGKPQLKVTQPRQ
jgi:hypothetical protein